MLRTLNRCGLSYSEHLVSLGRSIKQMWENQGMTLRRTHHGANAVGSSLTVQATLQMMQSNGWHDDSSSDGVHSMSSDKTGQIVVLVGEPDTVLTGEPLRRILDLLRI